jgi:hypothetical protein
LVDYREEAARMWEKRDAEWARESKARERLMSEVSAGLVDFYSVLLCIVQYQTVRHKIRHVEFQ